MSKNKNILQKIRDIFPVFVWVVGIFVIFANLWLVSKLAPIQQNYSIMAQEIININKKLDEGTKQHENFISKDTFNQIVTRIDHISSRVDQIFNIVAQNK